MHCEPSMGVARYCGDFRAGSERFTSERVEANCRLFAKYEIVDRLVESRVCNVFREMVKRGRT